MMLNKIVAVLLFGLIVSCSKSDSSNPITTTTPPVVVKPPTYYFKCKVNGVATDFKAMTLIKDDPTNIQQLYLVGAIADKKKPILTYTLNYKGAGWVDGLSYKLDEHDLVNFVEYQDEGGFIYKSIATPGQGASGLTLNFSKIILPKDSFASGTFSGTLQLQENTNTVTITEGVFKVQFLN